MDSRKEVAYRDTPAFNNVNKSMSCVDLYISEVGIYKRKQENKNSTEKVIKKKRKFSFFLGRFLGRERVFFLFFLTFLFFL